MAPSSRFASVPGCGATALSLVFVTAACGTGTAPSQAVVAPAALSVSAAPSAPSATSTASASSSEDLERDGAVRGPVVSRSGRRRRQYGARPGRDDPEAGGPQADGGLPNRLSPGSRGRGRVDLDRERVPRHRDADRCRIRRRDVDQGGSRDRPAADRRGWRCGLVRGCRRTGPDRRREQRGRSARRRLRHQHRVRVRQPVGRRDRRRDPGRSQDRPRRRRRSGPKRPPASCARSAQRTTRCGWAAATSCPGSTRHPTRSVRR